MKIAHTTYDAAHNIRVRRPSTATDKIKQFLGIASHKTDEVSGPEKKRVRFDLSNTTSKQDTRKEEASCSTHVPLYGWASGKFRNDSGYQVLGDNQPPKKIVKKRDIQRPIKVSIPTATKSTPKLNHAPNVPVNLEAYGVSSSPPLPLAPTIEPSRKKAPSHANKKHEAPQPRESKSESHKKATVYQWHTYLNHKQREVLIDDQDSDSSESFFCSGDPTSTENSNTLLISPNTSESRATRLSANHRKSDSCRLCHYRNAAGARGICIECDNTYCCPNPNIFDDSYEIKPIHTLKLKTQREDVAQAVIVTKISSPQSPPPILPLKENELRKLKVYNVSKTTVVSEPIRHQPSKRAVLGNIEQPVLRNFDASGNPAIFSAGSNHCPSQRVLMGRVGRMGSARKVVHKSVRWQKEEIRRAYEKASSAKENDDDDEYGSSTYNSPVNSPEGGEEVEAALLGGNLKGKGVQKSASFYKFYDDILRNLGAVTPLCEEKALRYDDL